MKSSICGEKMRSSRCVWFSQVANALCIMICMCSQLETKDFKLALEFLVREHAHLQSREAFYAQMEAENAALRQQLVVATEEIGRKAAENLELRSGAALFAKRLADAHEGEMVEMRAMAAYTAQLQAENVGLRKLATSFTASVSQPVAATEGFIRHGVRSVEGEHKEHVSVSATVS
jgi:hypothetical protein